MTSSKKAVHSWCEIFPNWGSNPGSSDSLKVMSDHWTIASVPDVAGVVIVYI